MNDKQFEQQEYELYERKMELVREQVAFFRENELFTWQWWLLLGLTIVPWIVWFLIRNKQIQARLVLGGLFAGLAALVLDIIGTQAGVWLYGIMLIPALPPLIPYDLALMPVSYMILQQFTKSKAQFMIWALLFSAVTAFLVEPMLNLIDVYYTGAWEEIYSFPIYFLIYYTAYKLSSISGWEHYYKK